MNNSIEQPGLCVCSNAVRHPYELSKAISVARNANWFQSISRVSELPRDDLVIRFTL
jgi:hypothetical protein